MATTAATAAASSRSSLGRRGKTLGGGRGAAATTATRLTAYIESADAAGSNARPNNGYHMDEGWMGNTWAVEGRGRGGGAVVGATREEVKPLATARAGENMEYTEESMEAAAKRSVPLKAMVFVDGTWLYYSFFGRCVRKRRWGGWGGWGWGNAGRFGIGRKGPKCVVCLCACFVAG